MARGPSIEGRGAISQGRGIVVGALLRVIDDFEDQDLSEYGGETGNYSIGTSNVWSGTYSLVPQSGSSETIISSVPGDGLNYYPQQGDTIKVYWYAPSQSNKTVSFLFGYANGSSCYEFEYVGFNTNLRLNDGVGGATFSSTGVSLSNSTWYYFLMEWGDPTITCGVYDTNDNLQAEVQVDDTQYADNRGWGINHDNHDNGDGAIDYAHVI